MKPSPAGRAPQRALAAVAATVGLLLQGSLSAAELIEPTLDASDFRVVVSYVSIDALVALQRKYGAQIDRRDIRQGHRDGFSILKTNRETGSRTCEIYLPNAARPRVRDDGGTLTLGHELLHCMLGDYHR